MWVLYNMLNREKDVTLLRMLKYATGRHRNRKTDLTIAKTTYET
jgi:hypothetical protein